VSNQAKGNPLEKEN